MANTRLSWGADGTAQAPYYLYFQCFPFPRTSRARANLSNPIAEIILPGVRINRGISHRYSEDAPMMENMAQALGTISDKFDVITMWDVLEHIPNPYDCLKQLSLLLKNDGLIFIMIPNASGHGGKITAVADGANVTLTQVEPGPDGNTAIVETLHANVNAISAAFTGG